MANYFARKAGNINAADVWATTPSGTAAAVTFAAGDVLMANSFAITVNVDTNLGAAGEVRNDTTGGATAGGSFTLSNGVTLTANCFANATALVLFSGTAGNSASIVGNCTGGTSAGGATGATAARNSSTGTLNITGNCTGGTGAIGANNASTGTLNITGNCTGGTGGTGVAGANNFSTGTLNITGNCTGGSGTGAVGANNASTGTILINGVIQASEFNAGVGGTSAQQVTLLTGPFLISPTFGVNPIVCTAWRWASALNNQTYLEVGTQTLLQKRNLVTPDNATNFPAASNVRSGITYGIGGVVTGTCAVPSPAAVAMGTPVDNTVGTLTISVPTASEIATAVWSAATKEITGGTITGGTVDTLVNAPSVPSASAIADEVRLELAPELSNLDATISSRLASASYTAPANSDISAIKSKTDNLPSDPADQSLVAAAISALTIPTATDIRTEMDSNSTKLANLDATISSRLADADYTAPTAAPTAAAVASAVRTELTEISNLDASISSRLAAADYTAPTSAPTAAAVASAVRSELTELSNLDASVSSRLASADYTTPPTTAQISAAVEGSLLDENDGQAVLNALVGAIGNQNVDEIALVAAIRSDLERSGGKLDNVPTAAANASAVWSAATKEITGGTVTNLTNAPASVTPSDIWTYATREITGGTVDTLVNAPSVPSASAIADEVRLELAPELSNLDAPVSGATAPTASTVATAVRSELSVELSNLDAPVSGATAPDAASVASAVRSELATELARVDAAVSSRATAANIPTADITAIKAKTDALNVDRVNNTATLSQVGNLLAQANS